MVILGPGASPAGHRNNGVAKGYEVSMAEQVVGQASTEVSMDEDVNVGKLSFPAMLSLVVGSMIGGGIFSLPQNIAAAASPGPMVIGWTITGIGMICLAMVYQKLAIRRPDLDNGIYAYAKAGFGDFIGFNSAWGYWLSALIGNVGYLVLLFSTVGKFVPAFAGGNTVWAVLAASVLLWLTHALVLAGVRTAAFVNTIATIAKIVPLITFIAICAVAFDVGVFTEDFWGSHAGLGSVFAQTKSMMLVTVWVFIGIEGASIYSKRARKRSDVGKATVGGFLFVLVLLIGVNLLSMGIMHRAKLAGLPDASMGDVLSSVVGPWGSVLVSAGVIISLLGALLAWILLCGETMQVPGEDGTMPKLFGRINKHEAPAPALWITNIVSQICLVMTVLWDGAYLAMATLAAALILVPYLLSAAFALKMVIKGETYENGPRSQRVRDAVVATVATLYGIWLVVAAGADALMLAALLYLPGAAVFVWAKREQRAKRIFKPYEIGVLVLLALISVVSIISIVTGRLSLT
ncbi:basic amino acid/polyamine antiporter [Cutibacterium sp.]|uniref:basic amino acid/polyamine antiporter n=1 Tax=Cutibacterium sp. TaxID=1912221 RepID=UPI0025847CB8|nr:basic amino acid/polyamine antiporter [Cutibacterium sp.]MCA3771250.1 amino acid permease [Cutibacterium sp.]